MMPMFNEYPVSFIESQASFSADIIKSHFAQMNQSQIDRYHLGQIIDILFAISYA